MLTNNIRITKDLMVKSVGVTAEFDASAERIWRALTEKDQLERWWGPAPWRAETRYHNFTEGGHWLYALVSPDGERYWMRVNYLAIDEYRLIEIEDLFCDEAGKITTALPTSIGKIELKPLPTGTRVEYRMYYSGTEEIEKIMAMGFEERITASYNQLTEHLSLDKI